MTSNGELQVATEALLSLDRLEQRLEVSFAERPRSFPLNDLEEKRRPILNRLAEDLEQIAVGIAVHEDAELGQLRHRLVDLSDATLELVVVARRHRQELHAAVVQRV